MYGLVPTARFSDSSRAILVGKWFHGGYLANVLAEGMKVALFGKVEFDSYAGELSMLHPEFEILSSEDDEGEAALHVGRVVPIYEGVARLTTRVLRTFMHRIFETLAPQEDCLPRFLRDRLKMPDRWTAIRDIHFPPPDSDLRLFGKPDAYKRRRMGVALATGRDIGQARDRARKCASRVLPRAA